jgi:hypothetical protein
MTGMTGSTIGTGTTTTTPGGRLQLIVGLPELEVVAEDPGPAPPLETGTDDEDPPVMVPEPVPLPEPTFGLEPEPAHPVLVATVAGRPPVGFAGFAGCTPPTKGEASPPPTGFAGCAKSPKITGGGSSLAGCGWNSGAGSVAPSIASDPKNADKAGCG